jgi:predicted dehydrogenase
MMGCEHILNIGLIPDARVVAIADTNQTSRSWGRTIAGEGVETYSDYREMLKSSPIDAVVIATPNFTHFEVLQEVLRTGKHVLVEKPLCTQVAHCHRIVEAVAKRKSLVWVGMEYRFMAAVTALIKEVHAETTGSMRMLAIREHRFPFLNKVDDWNRFNRNTGGTLVEKCCHFFDLMNHVTQQRPVRVYASGAQDVNHLQETYNGETPDIIDNAFAVVDFDGGRRALLDLCMFAENSINEVEITATGDKGKVQAFLPENALYICRRDGSAHEKRTFEVDAQVRRAGAHHGSTYFEHLAFLEAIRSGGKPVVTVEDGALAVAVGAAAEQSIRQGKPVELKELGF